MKQWENRISIITLGIAIVLFIANLMSEFFETGELLIKESASIGLMSAIVFLICVWVCLEKYKTITMIGLIILFGMANIVLEEWIVLVWKDVITFNMFCILEACAFWIIAYGMAKTMEEEEILDLLAKSEKDIQEELSDSITEDDNS